MKTEYAEWVEEEIDFECLEDRLNYLFRLSDHSSDLEEDVEKEFNYVTGGF